MNIAEVQSKHKLIYHDLKVKGTINKILFFFQILFLVFYYNFSDLESLKALIYWVAIVAIISGFILLTINSLTFVNSRKVRSANRSFKDDFFDCAKQDIPEFECYIPAQKIHPKLFYASGLFPRRYDDYIGDDWICGHYKGIQFELCELHVFKLFRNIFGGIFIRCKFSKVFDRTIIHFDDHSLSSALCSPAVTDQIIKFRETYKATIHLSYINSNIFIAANVKGNFFENKNKKMISKLDKDFSMLKEIVEMLRTIISEQNCSAGFLL